MLDPTYVAGRAARWSGVLAGVVGVVISGYFLVASALAKMNFFGEEVTPDQRARSEQLMTWCLITLFVGTPVAVGVGRWCVRSVERARAGDAASCAWTLTLCAPVAFGVALLALPLVPSTARPLVFGVLWLMGSAVVLPLVVAAAFRRRTRADV